MTFFSEVIGRLISFLLEYPIHLAQVRNIDMELKAELVKQASYSQLCLFASWNDLSQMREQAFNFKVPLDMIYIYTLIISEEW